MSNVQPEPREVIVESIPISQTWDDAQQWIAPVFAAPQLIESASCIAQILPASLLASVGKSDFSGSVGQQLQLHSQAGSNVLRMLLLGLGEHDRAAIDIRSAAAILGRQRASDDAAHVLIDDLLKESHLRSFVEGFLMGVWEKGADAQAPSPKEPLTLVLRHGANHECGAIQEVCRRGYHIAEATHLARAISNAPASSLTPTMLDKLAAHIADTAGLTFSALNQDEIRDAQLAGVLAVSKGSSELPAFITLEHKPSGSSGNPVVLIGKGVTFDSGGLTLKPGTGLPRMKHDKAGAGVVLAVMKALAALEIQQHVIAIIPTVENMPGGAATRPGDVLTMADDTTVEIISTDAEGRLILADALIYAKRFTPKLVIDVATLCGATRIALGSEAGAVFSNSESILKHLVDAGTTVDEPVWPMPLLPGYLSDLRSPFADLRNSTLGKSKGGGACIAAAFLHEFASENWAHIDIAGVAWDNHSRTYYPREGASGFGVRLLIELLSHNPA